MEVEQTCEQIDISDVLTSLLSDCSAVTDYRTLRDSLPRRLASLLKCRCVLLYLRVNETLQLAAGSFDDIPGWSSALLAVAHVNPISVLSDLPEARAWRQRQIIHVPVHTPTLMVAPLLYRERAIGVLVAIRGQDEGRLQYPLYWSSDTAKLLQSVAGVVALLLENTRLLERDRERIHELSLLNSMSIQMQSTNYDLERLRNIVLQRSREISCVDLCDLWMASTETGCIPWLSQSLCDLLFERFQAQQSAAPIIIERVADGIYCPGQEYFDHLSANIKTFFALPLLSSRVSSKHSSRMKPIVTQEGPQVPKVLGYIVGGYYRPWKMRHAEIALLQVLASQASAVLENMRLMDEVVEARNQARKLLRQVLEDQRLKEMILASMPSGLITTDECGYIHTFNRAAEVILGYHSYEVAGKPLLKFLNLESVRSLIKSQDASSDEPKAHQAALAAMHSGEAQHQTVGVVDRYDRELILDVDVQPLYDEKNKLIGTLVTFTDMTSMHRLEEEKRRLDRLASLGEMAAGVAHEVRNPLASIKTSIQILRDDFKDNELASLSMEEITERISWMQESITVVLKEVERLDTLVRELLLFAKPRQLHRARCIITDLLDHVLAMVQRQCIDVHVEVRRSYEELSPIWLDMGQMEQVLLNLILNAIQAMSDGGVLTVSCHCIPTEQALYDAAGTECPPTQRPSGASGTAVSAYAWLIDKQVTQEELRVTRWLEIIVSDTGVGIAQDQLQHIFQPFYTTKAHGIGLGLAITRRLVEDHGGYLRIESQFGCGSAISVRVPFVTDGSVSTNLASGESHERSVS